MFFQPDRSLFRGFIITCLILIAAAFLSPIDSAAQIKLAWDSDADTGVIGYKVYYGAASRTYGAPTDVGNVTTCTLNGLTPGVTYYIAVTAYNTAHYESGYSNEVTGKITETVSTPNTPSGPTNGISGMSYSYTTGGSASSLGNPVQYQFDWRGDGTDLSPWGPATQEKTRTAAGSYNVKARAASAVNTSVVSNWSGLLPVTVSAPAASFIVTTNPSGLQIIADGSTYTAPQSFNWVYGSSHTLSVPSPQSGTSGVRYIYGSWSDGGAQSHTVTVLSSSTIYTANLTTQYSLTTSLNPAGGGTVNPSGTNWYSNGQSVSVSATANSGYALGSWSGDLSGSTNPSSILMNGEKSLTANFARVNSSPKSLKMRFMTETGDTITTNVNIVGYTYLDGDNRTLAIILQDPLNFAFTSTHPDIGIAGVPGGNCTMPGDGSVIVSAGNAFSFGVHSTTSGAALSAPIRPVNSSGSQATFSNGLFQWSTTPEDIGTYLAIFESTIITPTPMTSQMVVRITIVP